MKIGNTEFYSLTHFRKGRYEYDLLAPFKTIKEDIKKMRAIAKERKGN